MLGLQVTMMSVGFDRKEISVYFDCTIVGIMLIIILVVVVIFVIWKIYKKINER